MDRETNKLKLIAKPRNVGFVTPFHRCCVKQNQTQRFRKNYILSLFLIISILFGINSKALADTKCHGKFVNPITDICWSCMLPMSVGSMHVVKGKHPDTKNPSSPVCMCQKGELPQVGITLGYWEPVGLVDVTRTPFCMVNLGGVRLNIGHYGSGTADNSDPSSSGSFYYAHFYVYPLLYWLNIISDAMCTETAEFDIGYLTELDPTWDDDELAFLLNPEAILFGNPIAQLSCSIDAIASTFRLPLDFMFWCAGSHGSMYPLEGFVQNHIGGVQASVLIAERMIYKLHRELLMWDSVGENSPQVCSRKMKAFLPKSRYRYQMTNPKPSASEPDGCKPFGHTTTKWELFHEYPYKGEDFGYLIWRKSNCCAF